MRILVVEDEESIAKFIKSVLKKNKYSADIAKDGEEALFMMKTNNFDAVVLDINLPKLSGFDLCKEIRSQREDMPILMLSARDSVKDKVKGLDFGADDYLSKPFSLDELLARIRALFRKSSGKKSGKIKIKDIILDINKRVIVKDEKIINLSSKEFAILEYLILKKNEVVSRAEILEHVWGESEENVFTNTVDVHINYLRRKIGKNVVKTMRGFGYILSM